jgi:hypothetical protein
MRPYSGPVCALIRSGLRRSIPPTARRPAAIGDTTDRRWARASWVGGTGPAPRCILARAHPYRDVT